MSVYTRFTQLSRFINENIERKPTTEAFLNEKFIQTSLCSKKFKVKELEVQFEVKVIEPACRARFS